MKNLIAATVVAFMAALSAPAHATLIDFEATGQSGSCGAGRTSTTSNGYTFVSSFHHVCNSLFPLYVANGTNYLANTGANTFTMTKVGGGAFTLKGLDAAESHYLPANTVNPISRFLLVEAVLLGGGTASQYLTFDGILDGRDGAADFQTFDVSAVFTDVVSVTFKGLLVQSPTSSQSRFSLDNIRVDQAAPLPEPASLLLVGGALAGLGLARRKAKRA